MASFVVHLELVAVPHIGKEAGFNIDVGKEQVVQEPEVISVVNIKSVS